MKRFFWNGVELTTPAELLAAVCDHVQQRIARRSSAPTLLELRAELERNGALPEDRGTEDGGRLWERRHS